MAILTPQEALERAQAAAEAARKAAEAAQAYAAEAAAAVSMEALLKPRFSAESSDARRRRRGSAPSP